MAERIAVHIHGTLGVCDCGAETGIATVALEEGYDPPERCDICGKPYDAWGDLKSARNVDEHTPGCPAGDPSLCDNCGRPVVTMAVLTEDDDGNHWSGHVECEPGVEGDQGVATMRVKLTLDESGPGSYAEILAYVEQALRENCVIRDDRMVTAIHEDKEARLARALVTSILHRMGVPGPLPPDCGDDLRE